ncbi:hypothetical protein AG1IA_02106 [Rhizoctonia solani AG-1 IA]|uniref:Uncharacterized protein n=1 Tax=Thanatephorus cucumeris (strain AG1-IA) TaxID=983506 RepID=L8X5E6_THACA|nr:hypothetical protein AG1IA_02106 [Rhizoctonia solani AG-1 IA]
MRNDEPKLCSSPCNWPRGPDEMRSTITIACRQDCLPPGASPVLLMLASDFSYRETIHGMDHRHVKWKNMEKAGEKTNAKAFVNNISEIWKKSEKIKSSTWLYRKGAVLSDTYCQRPIIRGT